jgi:N6-adenosine-specific RNA methylase IME4
MGAANGADLGAERKRAMSDIADANQAYGALTEGFYIAGFTFERAMARSLQLLKTGLWMKVGDGFDDVNEFVRSLQLDRFKVVAEQRREFVEQVKELQPAISNRAIAEALGVDRRTVDRDVGANAPRGALDRPENEGAGGANAPPGAADGRRDAASIGRRDTREDRRAEREAELGAFQAALPQKSYGVIYADPPWRWEAYSSETGLDRGPSSHYPTMALDAIKALDVGGIAAADCALFLWTTAPMLPEALDLMAAWGFRYRTGVIWAKDRIGMGYWFRSRHEHLLIGTRGDIPAPAPGTQWHSLIEAPVREHSRKPDQAYEIIEAYFPNMPKIELFARAARTGWDAWGNEAPATLEMERSP